jgi:hypothetical protein
MKVTTPQVPHSLARHGITAAELDAWLARSRGRQGLPLHVHDPAILAEVAALVVEGFREMEADDLDAAA